MRFEPLPIQEANWLCALLSTMLAMLPRSAGTQVALSFSLASKRGTSPPVSMRSGDRREDVVLASRRSLKNERGRTVSTAVSAATFSACDTSAEGVRRSAAAWSEARAGTERKESAD